MNKNNLINLLKQTKLGIKIISIWYGHEFKRGYQYLKIKHINLDLLEKHHYIIISDGWGKDSDITADFTHAYCWYKRPINQNN